MSTVNTESRARQVGFIGVGLMGAGMVTSLARRGHSLKLHNRTRARAEAVAPPGAVVVDSPAEAARGSEVVILMLSDAAALRAVLEGPQGLLAGIAPGTVVIDSSTVDPNTTKLNAARLAERGAKLLDAPVYGSKNEASSGQLGFMVGGDPEVFTQVNDLFVGCMGRVVHYMGQSGAGTTTKLALNTSIALALNAAQEGLVLATKAGIDPKAMCEVLMASRARSGILEMKAPGMLSGDFTPFFPLRLMDKDLNLALDTAHRLGVSMPALAAVKQVFSACMSAGQADEDFCATIRFLARCAGAEIGASKGPA